MAKKIQLKHSEGYYLKVLLKEAKLSEIMSQPPITLDVSIRFSEVPKIMQSHRIRHLPVVNQKKQVVGLITQRDLFKIAPPRKLEDGTLYYDDKLLDEIILENVMIASPFCMQAQDCIGDALVEIANRKFGCIPIVNEDKVIAGIVTQVDLIQIAAQIYQE